MQTQTYEVDFTVVPSSEDVDPSAVVREDIVERFYELSGRNLCDNRMSGGDSAQNDPKE